MRRSHSPLPTAQQKIPRKARNEVSAMGTDLFADFCSAATSKREGDLGRFFVLSLNKFLQTSYLVLITTQL
jgi:hypothetical protein